MFGRRSDGYLIRNIDPIVALMPHIMSERNDAMVQLEYEIDYGRRARYVVSKEQEGVKLTFMDVVIAAFVRTIAELPELNRFIINKRVYARKTLSVSFAVLRSNGENVSDVDENTTKCYFDPHDTIFDVARRMNEVIEEARKPVPVNATDKLAGALLKVPGLPNLVVLLARFLDNHGIMPRFIHEASPFHTSLWVSNMASIGMSYIYHHIYDFGSTSIFVTLGRPEQKLVRNSDGTCRAKRIMPVGVVIDERIGEGAMFARMFSTVVRYLNDPQQLEKRPEHVKTEIEMIPAPPIQKTGA